MGKLLSEMISDLGKCPHQKTHESESAGALPKVQNYLWKQFSHKVLYNYYSKFFFGAFWWVFNKIKKGISHCIFKNVFVQFWGLFSHRRVKIWYTISYDCPEEPEREDRCCLWYHPFMALPYSWVIIDQFVHDLLQEFWKRPLPTL